MELRPYYRYLNIVLSSIKKNLPNNSNNLFIRTSIIANKIIKSFIFTKR